MVDAISTQAMFAAGVVGGSSGIFNSLTSPLGYAFNNVFQTQLADPGSVIRNWWLYPDMRKQFEGLLGTHGFREDSIQQILSASQRWLTPEEVIRLYLIGGFTDEELLSYELRDGTKKTITLDEALERCNIPKGQANLYKRLVHRPLPLQSSIAMLRRFGQYSEADKEKPVLQWSADPKSGEYFREYKESKKYEGLDLISDDVLLKASRSFPHTQDIIRFAVREVFSPEIAERLSLYQDMPPRFVEEARKSGLSPEHASWYWAAHWDLPSYTQGTEMFQRGIITHDDLKLLLRALDYAPVWRDRMIELAYRRVTRVDLQRFYRTGVIPRLDMSLVPDQEPDDRSSLPIIIQRHLELGYNYRDSVERSKWIDLQFPNAAIQASIKAASSAFEKNYLDKAEYDEILKALNLPESNRTFIIAEATAKRDMRFLDNEVKRNKPLLRNGTITAVQFRRNMETAGLSPDSVQRIINEVEAERADKARGLTAAEVIRLFKRGIIKQRSQAETLLQAAGLTAFAIARLLDEILLQRETGAGVVPLADMKSMFAAQLITVERFKSYLEAEGWQSWAVNALTESLNGVAIQRLNR